MTKNSDLLWLPKKSSYPIDTSQKPYYCMSKKHTSARLTTTALLGLAPVCFTRAFPPTTREKSSLACMMTWV
jgi:hypothetical protein